MSEYQYINFSEIQKKTKTSVYECRNNKSGDVLGIIKWYPAWRQYCYFPSCPAVYSKGCLDDIAHFINKIMEERKSGRE